MLFFTALFALDHYHELSLSVPHSNFFYLLIFIITSMKTPVADPGFPRGAPTPKVECQLIIWPFFRKLHENEIRPREGAATEHQRWYRLSKFKNLNFE